MGKISIDSLYSDQKGRCGTREWYKLIQQNLSKYDKISVVSFTRVKDLNSDWKHEYIQFIVEEQDTKERARVYAERGNEKDLDWITFGPAENKVSGSKHDKDLPLPLTSITFGGPDGKDVTKRPKLLDIAKILSAITDIGGPYDLFGHSCFWYAYTVWESIKVNFGKLGKIKYWRWGDIGGAGNAGFKDAIGLGWTKLFRWRYVGSAKEFKKEREGNMIFDVDDRAVVDPTKVVNEIATALGSSSFMERYLAEMDAQLIDIDAEEVKTQLAVSKELARKETQSDPSANWTKEFEDLNHEIIGRVFSDPEAQSLLKKYESLSFDPIDEHSFRGSTSYFALQTAQAIGIVVARTQELLRKEYDFQPVPTEPKEAV